ncbi:relaxase/mobilization nuclease domain-containing protein [Roseateles sp. DC23W]|uniref:Relaxase/mobilization nuclease domain-containing protein n=1 Tax=Pelomonas dachongensis TaxID=3299029 RepID=A0ABW7EGI1_9BURK
MSAGRNVDDVLVQWGDRLFYPGNRIVKPLHTPKLTARAGAIRNRIVGVVRRAPQVIVKTGGGGKGMSAIHDHLRYITRNGELEFEDDRGEVREGKEALLDLERQWRYGGAFIPNISTRQESRNLMLAMPAGTDAQGVRQAARECARTVLAGYRYVMVLHTHQTSPHVHLCVKNQSITGERLSIGPPDLKRWRATFAEKLRDRGIEAEATPQAARGATRKFHTLWQLKARDAGRLSAKIHETKSGPVVEKTLGDALEAWSNILVALRESDRHDDRDLATQVGDFLCRTPYVREVLRRDPEAMPGVRRYLEDNRGRIEESERSWRRERAAALERATSVERGRQSNGLEGTTQRTQTGPEIVR